MKFSFYNKYLNEIIPELIKRKARIELEEEGVRVYGFYKSSSILLTLEENSNNDETIIAIARYGNSSIIYDFDDLVSLHYSWFNYSKNRYTGWSEPDSNWKDDYIRLGFINNDADY